MTKNTFAAGLTFNFPTQCCLGSFSNGFSMHNFSVDYNSIDKSDIKYSQVFNDKE